MAGDGAPAGKARTNLALRARWATTACTALAVALACPQPGTDDAPPPTKPVDTRAFVKQAQRTALERGGRETLTVLIRADPLAAWRIGAHELALTPTRAGALAELRPLVDAAWKTVADIDSQALPLADRALLRALRFGLSRLRDHMLRRPPWRTDPAWVTRELDRFLVALATETREQPWTPARTRAIDSAAADLSAIAADLGGASEPALLASARHCRTLAQRVRRLATAQEDDAPGTALTGLAQAIGAVATRWELVATALPNTATATWDQPIAAAGAPEHVKRLPGRMGSVAFRRMLEVEEAVNTPPATLHRDAIDTLRRFDAMARTKPQASTAPDRPVSVSRCNRAWAPIATWAAAQPTLAVAGFECSTRHAEIAPCDDTELTIALIDAGVVQPVERARVREELAVLTLVSGELAPFAHALSLALAVSSGIRNDAVTGRLLAQAQARLCETATALWIHADLGDAASLQTQLQQVCPSRSPSTWIDAAEADPKAAMRGLGMTRLGAGPADVVALQQYWWAPLGLVQSLADPASLDPPSTPVNVEVEDLTPATELPDGR